MQSSANTPAFRVRAYPRLWRFIAGMLVAVSRAGLLVILLLVAVSEEPITLTMLVRALAILSLLPGFAAWLIERAFTVDVRVQDGELIADGRDLRLEIPCASISNVAPWSVPLPGPGFSISMRSGRRLSRGVQADDPVPVLSALAEHGAVAAAGVATGHPVCLYAHAKQSIGRWRWYHLLVKFVVFGFLPAAVFFNAHQHIAYGGPLGEYHLLGLKAYLRTLGVYWATMSIYLILYASLWRGLAEAVALLSAWGAPSRAALVRRTAERGGQVLYYGGVPVLVLLRFLP